VLTRDLLRATSVPGAHCLEHRPVLVLRDDQDLLLSRERRLRREQRAGRGERQRDDVRDRPRDRVALRQVDELAVVVVVQLDEPLQDRRRPADDAVELSDPPVRRLQVP